MSGSFAITAAGRVCVACLRALRRVPAGVSGRLLSPAVRLYPLFRPRHAARLKACFAAAPIHFSLSLRDYYSTRLRLMLRGLAFHGKPFPAASSQGWTPDLKVIVHGEKHYRDALERNRPIALIGLHAGMVELLHRIPEAPDGRPFLVLTTPAFSPPLTRFMARGREMEGKRVLWVGQRDGKDAKRNIADGNGSGGRNVPGGGQRGLVQGLRSVIACNGVLALMADQHPGPANECDYLTLWNSVRVPWPARLIRFLVSKGFQCLPVSTRMLRNTDAGETQGAKETARFDFHPVVPQADADGIRAFLEKAIAEAPEQWNWSYPKVQTVAAIPARAPGGAPRANP